MARKRGGVAGLWDRNKGWLQYVAPAVVGAIPGLGPLAAAGLGAAMGGLDRPGKGGIGVDVGGAVRGGITGYGAGNIGKSVSGGIGKMFNPAGAAQASQNIPPKVTPGSAAGNVINPALADAAGGAAAPAVAPPVTPPPASPPPPADTKELTGFAKYLDVANKNAKVLEMIGKGVQSQLPNPQFQLQQQQYEEQLRQQKLREERQAIMARLLIPLLAQQQGKIPPQSLSEYITGYGPSGYNNMA